MRSWRGALFILALIALGSSAFADNIDFAKALEQTGSQPKLQATLQHLVSFVKAGGIPLKFTPTSSAARFSKLSFGNGGSMPSLKMSGDDVRVVVETFGDLGAASDRINQLGGQIELTNRTHIQAMVPVTALQQIANLDSVKFVRLPIQALRKSQPKVAQAAGATTSEGVMQIGSELWNEAGITGEGVTIGVIDVEFGLYQDLLGTELPPEERVNARAFSSGGEFFDPDGPEDAQVHGTAVAEVITDIAPDVSLNLAAFDTDVGLGAAIDWMIAQDVDIISSSIGIDSGCFDPSGGIFEPQIALAKRRGISWATASGNEADIHWEDRWTDSDGDGLHNHTTSDNHNTASVFLDEFDYGDGRVVATAIIFGIMSWDAPCTGAADDYEAAIFREENGELIELPEFDGELGQIADWSWQPGRPIKFFFGTWDFDQARIGEFENFHIGIRKINPDAPDVVVDIMYYGCPCPEIEYLMARGSVGVEEPSISPNAIAVGAAHHGVCTQSGGSGFFCPDGRLLAYSSQGPTKDERLKPQIAAPSHVSTFAYGEYTGNGFEDNPGFTGTSAATPHTAGALALVLQAFRERGESPTPDEILGFLEDRAEDLAVAGPDNQYGAGLLLLGALPNITQEPTPPPTITDIIPANGTPGTTLGAILRGTDLAGATEVSFSGAGVTAIVDDSNSATQIFITVAIAEDAEPGARAISVTTPGGTGTSEEIVFTVDAIAQPGELVVLPFIALEFASPGDWTRSFAASCITYTNTGSEASLVRITMPDNSVREFNVPVDKRVIVCGDVVHIDTR